MSVEPPRLAVLGVGAMGSALAEGIVKAGVGDPGRTTLYDTDAARLRAVAERTGASAASSAAEAVRSAEAVLLCVKPGQVVDLLTSVAASLGSSRLVISIAAGIRTATIEHAVGPGTPVVRAMPNIAATVGAGAIAVCRGAAATEAHLHLAERVLGAVGLVWRVPEALMDAVTAISGSGIAFVFMFAEALADGGVRCGLPRDLAIAMAAQTVAGGAALVAAGEAHPGALKDRVASPAGTTIEGISALEERGFRGSVICAVTAAARRARELGQQ